MTSDALQLTVINAFLARVLHDSERSELLDLAEYQALWPGFETLIASQWALTFAPEEQTETHDGTAQLGQRVGPYVLERELGRGGQGIVYLARDTRLPRHVALKVLPVDGLLTKASVERLRREAEALSRISHPGVCSIIEIAQHERLAYIAMTYVRGQTLAALLSERRADAPEPGSDSGASTTDLTATGLAETSNTLRLMERSARAVHAAHEAGLLHRDIKPGNIMVDDGGLPVVLDFGLARDLEAGPTTTMTGDIVGTPAYMAPEQVEGRFDLDPRTDVWALGVTLFEALTLKRPFAGATRQEVLRAILEDPLPESRGLPRSMRRDLRVVLETAMQKERSLRYDSAAIFADELRCVRKMRPIKARPVSLRVKLMQWARRNRTLAVASAASIALLIGIALLSLIAAIALSAKNDENRQLAARERVYRMEATRQLYFSEMILAGQALSEVGGIQRIRTLLNNWTEPEAGFEDPRGFEWSLLKAVAHRELTTIPMSSPAMAASWHPKGTMFAVAAGGLVTIFASDSQKVLREIPIPNEFLLCVEFSGDGAYLAVGGLNGLSVFETSTFARVPAANEGHALVGLGFAPTHDGIVATAADGSCLKLFSLEDQTMKRLFLGELTPTTRLGYSPNGRHLLVGGREGSVHLIDAVTNESTLYHPNVPTYPVSTLAWHPGGATFASATCLGDINVFKIGQALPVLTLNLGRTNIQSLDFSPDGGTLTTGAFDHSVRLFDATSGEELDQLRGHEGPVRRVAWSPDGSCLLSCSEDGTAKLWAPSQSPPIRRLPPLPESDELSVQWTEDGDVIASNLRHYRTYHHAGVTFTSGPPGHAQPKRHLKLDRVASVHERSIVISNAAGISLQKSAALPGQDSITACWHPIADRLAVSADNKIYLWELGRADASPQMIHDAGSSITAMTFANERLVYAAQQELVVLDPSTSTRIATRWLESYGSYRCLEVSPGGLLLAVGSTDQTIRIVDLQQLAERQCLRGHTNTVNAVSWLRDGSRLASTADDGTVRLWETGRGHLAMTLPLPSVGFGVGFSKDGLRLAAISADGIVHVWDTTPAAAERPTELGDSRGLAPATNRRTR